MAIYLLLLVELSPLIILRKVLMTSLKVGIDASDELKDFYRLENYI